jgi:hypothetical protein
MVILLSRDGATRFDDHSPWHAAIRREVFWRFVRHPVKAKQEIANGWWPRHIARRVGLAGDDEATMQEVRAILEVVRKEARRHRTSLKNHPDVPEWRRRQDGLPDAVTMRRLAREWRP